MIIHAAAALAIVALLASCKSPVQSSSQDESAALTFTFAISGQAGQDGGSGASSGGGLLLLSEKAPR